MSETKEKELKPSKRIALTIYLVSAIILISTCFAFSKTNEQEIKRTTIKTELSK